MNQRLRLALLGHPVGHSRSPAMHRSGFEAAGVDGIYEAFDIEPQRLPAALDGLRVLGFNGANVTVPHKERVWELVDRRSVATDVIGAVNTIAFQEGRMLGANTDPAGFLYLMFRHRIPVGGHALILGAGGAARSVLYALWTAGLETVTVANRHPERAETMVAQLQEAGADARREGRVGLEAALDDLGFRSASLLETADRWHCSAVALNSEALQTSLKTADLVINATPLGMAGRWAGMSPLSRQSIACLTSDAVVVDLVYEPAMTPLRKQAEAAGLRHVGGASMLIGQGAVSWRYWLGRTGPVEAFEQGFHRA